MDPAVRIERGYYLIDTDAWVDQRAGDRAGDITALLRELTTMIPSREAEHRAALP